MNQPVEQLLDELDAEYASREQYPDLVGNIKASLHYALLFLGNWPRLSKELRQRLERFRLCEQVQKRGDSSVTCACIEPALRQRVEKEKQSDVEAALIELREMSPEPHLGRVFVTQKFCYSTEDNGAFEVWNIEGRIFGDSPFVGRTLEEAMQEIRQWKEESK